MKAVAGFRREAFTRDFTASIVVFLVAVPLCLGIAVASGVPPEKGLITGIIGGIVVGFLSGSPLQVSGPAAGLAVIVFDLVQQYGLAMLGPLLVLAGLIQVAAGVFRLGGLFRAISPAVVHGMLAGIGVLILVGQFHVMFDAAPMASGFQNLAAMPGRLLGLGEGGIASAEAAFAVAVVTIASLLGWERLRPAKLRLLPGALVGVIAGTAAAAGIASIGFNVERVSVPDSLLGALAPPAMTGFADLLQPSLLALAVAIAFIASAETLLSAAAVDRMHDGVRTDYNKELRAQGIGNLLCGLAGALPMTGVIVRSSANVQAGAKTRASAMIHGVWILAFVALLPFVLQMIPMAALAAVLVVVGYRLVNLRHVTDLFRHYGPVPVVIWAVTLAMVVATDLLTGVLVGIGLSLLELIPHVRNIGLRIDTDAHDEAHTVRLNGAATFITLPKLTRTLEGLPDGGRVRLDLSNIAAVDHTSAEHLHDWVQRRRDAGHTVDLHHPPGKAGSGPLRRLAA
ncbi:SulP family inorganic anion transporter [Stakelama saccharophila]|uniref:SulP family inorganic anion transporter n=1 Tax=Stakelama saccharophila TaxID=3075605 RepID=A0ABZ0B6V6_9SPHN|nr:SulP family inorganic anion transporter [Stakelama sp. W311]WNO52846.1 SulP family inorganic anion transporter [Stakelama sp. W311]